MHLPNIKKRYSSSYILYGEENLRFKGSLTNDSELSNTIDLAQVLKAGMVLTLKYP